MSNSTITNILLVEDNPGDANLVEMMLIEPEDAHYQLFIADRMSKATELVGQHEFHVALLDMSLPDGEGVDNIFLLKSHSPDLPIVVLSGRFDEQFALEAVKAGAQDYLIKGEVDEWQLSKALDYAIERKRLHENVTYMAHYDQLTGLANRMLYRSRLEHAISCAARRNEQVALLYLDLDHFKPVNDALGHEIGDKLLIEVAERLLSSVRDMDTVARLGGDEFALILEGVKNGVDVVAVANKILQALTNTFVIDNHTLYIGTSIGIAFFPHCGRSVDVLTKNADNAMYKAKQNGRNQYQFYTSQMNQHALSELKKEMQLREALEKDEFILHYQPKLELATGRLSGNEALLRWNQTQQGIIYPDKFIPILEQTGLITEVGCWVLKTACEQHVEWKRQGFDVGKIAINLSGRQLLHRNFSKTVRDVLNETGLDASSLEVELTESLLIRNTGLTIETLNELKEMGVSIAIDDFGTGYSSFNYLKSFLIDTLKIDRSFIKNITREGPEAAITSAIIHLAKDLGIHVIAEGVETKEQMNFLREKKIDEIQGYYISPPVSSDAFTHLIKSNAA